MSQLVLVTAGTLRIVAGDAKTTEHEDGARGDWWARAIGVAQVAATLGAVVLAGFLVFNQKQSDAQEAGRAAMKAYAVQFGVIAQGVEDMVKCREMLPLYAIGEGARVAFQDLKSLGAVLKGPQLKSVQEASDQLDRLFEPKYSAPLAGTEAAYRAWSTSYVLQGRATRARGLLRAAVKALGGQEPGTDPCYGRERKARAAHRLHSGRLEPKSAG